ncbi:unnamed protein product, partial [Adineta steineri]
NMQLAVALYHNDVDDDDELEFRKGDILTVLIENPKGFDGWWLCKHKNKCGLCPENRLKLIQNTTSSSIPSNDFVNCCSRLSTISMYDSLSNSYDKAPSESSLNRNYDNREKSDFICNIKSFDSSPDSSSRSSGIYSANDPHLSSSSSVEFFASINNDQSLSLLDLNQLENSFRKLSIHSLIIDKYRQLISKTNNNTILNSFITECYLFLQNYGCLLDRYTYKLIKETFLYDLEHKKKRIIQSSTKIIQLIKLIIDLRLKENSPKNNSTISNDVFKKLHLKPIDEKLTALPKTQVNGNLSNKNQRSHIENSKIPLSNFLTESSSNNKLNHSVDPLIKCYYRHINQQIDLIIRRYSYLLDSEYTTSSFITEGKALVVAGHKLVFVLETLHEHLHQIQTPLIHLTTQLCETLTNSIQLLKQFSQQNCTNIQKLMIQFKQDIKMIMNIVKRIKQNCSLA